MSDIITQKENKVKSENPTNNGDNLVRDEQGRVVSGVLNPAGKPKGARHFGTLFREAVERVADGGTEKEDILIVKKVIDKAKEGDLKAADMIFDRVEGKPAQSIDLTTKDEKIGSSVSLELIKEFEEKLKAQLAE